MRVLPLIFIVVISVFTCSAQSNATLEVIVRDPSGALMLTISMPRSSAGVS